MDHARFCRGVVFKGVPGIPNVMIGAVRALCLRCAKMPPRFEKKGKPKSHGFQCRLTSTTRRRVIRASTHTHGPPGEA